MESLRPEDPRTLGAYRLLGRLGAGGMGRVYLARSDRGRTVAVKLVHRELAGREEFRRRFRAEVRAARQVGGEWTAPVLDADNDAEIPWVATGYIAGPSLRQVVGRDFGPLPERSVRILGAGLARALQAIHAAGVVHRDLKPSNVLITLDGPRVIDFGIARALESVPDGDGLTRTGAAVGSPGFMSPEQVRGARVTAASDVFCLGSVLAYAATGRLPFGTADSGVHALMYRIAEEEPDLTGVPGSLRPLILEFLAKDPADRPAPAQVLERTGVEELPADLASTDPWLPGPLVAGLGRHAVRLLDVEEPVRSADPLPPAVPAPDPTLISPPGPPPAAEPPTVTAGRTVSQPLPPPACGHPHAGPYGTTTHAGYAPPPPPPRRSRTPAVLAAVVAAGLLAGGGAVYLFKRGGDDSAHGPAPAPSTPGAPTPSSGTLPATTPGDGKDPGPVPQTFLGTWQSDFSTKGGPNTRRIVISQGSVGSPVADIAGNGTTDDGTVYRCAWTAPLSGGGTSGAPLRLGPSTVTLGEPSDACSPGEPTELTILPDGSLSRRFVGTAKAPLTYRKAG
ncbi:serine/threonine-protein kinase [Streptomyces blastmyceticus]|uniref:Protein kinase domain-containing protein n=1 Tax=Streptomyces blastmyceticus TaxID=68180 RepID=A0ABP3GNI9_9ACTN